MTVEIKELVIRAIVAPEGGETQENAGETAASAPMLDSSSDRDALIQECVRQVLRILQKKEER